jgi:hypothetical protein
VAGVAICPGALPRHGTAAPADGRHFDRAYLLRGEKDRQPQRNPGAHKCAGCSYPHAVVWRDWIFILYAMNKEDAQVTRVPLESLRNRPGKETPAK